MNIVYIIPEISNPGGIGRVTAIKANYFADKGDTVSIITEIQDNTPSFYYLNSKIKLYDIGLSKCKNKLLKFFLRKKRIKALLENIRPDTVIYTFFTSPILCSFKYTSILECHFNHDVAILKAYAFGESILKAKCMTKYYEYIASKVDVLVVLTKQDKKMWEKVHLRSKIIVIPNMNSFPADKLSDLSSKKVIAVGRLDAQKSFDRLIQIWSQIYYNHNDWQLNIYGKGPDKVKLINLIKDLGLESSICINAPVKDIKSKFLESSIFCFTSTYEGWGLALTEAMSCGLPVISYDIPCGPKDIISDNDNGFLVTNGDIERFAKALSQLMENKELRISMGRKAKESIKKYEIKTIMRKWNEVLTKNKTL